MKKNFLKRNGLYIALFCLILALNVLSRFKEERSQPPKGKVKIEEKKETATLFVDFEEAQKRSKKIEEKIRSNPPLYLLYLSANLLIVFIFLSGLAVNGYFIAGRFKGRNIIQKTCDAIPPAWTIGDIFKILILAVSFSYAFFIVFGFLIGIVEGFTGTKFTFFENENFRMVFDTIILDVAVFLVIFWFLRNVYKKKIASLGFGRGNIYKNIFYGIAGYVGVIPVILILGVLIYIILNIYEIKPPPQPIVGLFLAEENLPLIFISSIIAAVFGPVMEEIFFRGVMYNAVKKKTGVFWAVFITSVLFSFLHTHAMTYFLVGFVPITILGMALAYLYEKTGSLIPSITLHVLNNLGSVFMVFLFKYFNQLTT